MIKCLFLFIFVWVALVFSAEDVFAQTWKKIIPLVSTCEDVKKVLRTERCDVSSSDYRFKKYTLNILFSDKDDKWKFKEKTVLEVGIILKEAILLKNYVTDFKDYKVSAELDVPEIKLYVNDKLGERLTVQKLYGEMWITSIFLYPSKKHIDNRLKKLNASDLTEISQ